jgi:hypothetical protein
MNDREAEAEMIEVPCRASDGIPLLAAEEWAACRGGLCVAGRRAGAKGPEPSACLAM